MSWADQVPLPRLRLTVQRLMAVVLVFGLVFWMTVEYHRDSSFTRGFGHKDVKMAFELYDDHTGAPIEGAVIRLIDMDLASIPDSPDHHEMKSGRDGSASKVVSLRFYVSHGIPSNRLRFYRVDYPGWQIVIQARGYQRFARMIQEYERKDRRFHNDGPPPPIVIRLHKEPPPGADDSKLKPQGVLSSDGNPDHPPS